MALPKEVQDELRRGIAEAEKAIKEIEPEVKRAQLAGIDIEDKAKALQLAKSRISLLKNQFGG